jgi:hypothetical protein
MNNINILFIIYIIFFIAAFILTGISASKNESFILQPYEWVQLIIGSILLGILLGFVRGTIINLPNSYELFTLFASFFFFWYLLSKFFTNLILKFSPGESSISKNVV